MQINFKKPNGPEFSFEVKERGAIPLTHPTPAIVELDLEKIDSIVKKDINSYVGPGGEEQKPEKHLRAQAKIKSGAEIEMPIMSATLYQNDNKFIETVKIRDGRHRLYNLLILGHKKAMVVVPEFQKSLFLKHFGYTKAEI